MQPCGTFNESYEQDKAVVRTRLQWGLLVLFLIVLFLVPQFISKAYLPMVNVIGIYIIAAVGLQIVMGYCGQINLGQSAFMGVGAFVCAMLSGKFGLPLWLCIIGGGLGATAYGAVFALPAVRVKGFYLALTTIAAQAIFTFILMRLPESWFGGVSGLTIKAGRLGGTVFNTMDNLYYLIMVCGVLLVFFAQNIVRSRLGRAFTAIRDNDLAAGMMGVNVFRYKVIAFCVCAFYAGIAGSLWAFYVRAINVETFTLWLSIWFAGMIIVGGQGSILGAILGAVFLRGMEEGMSLFSASLGTVWPQITTLIFPLTNVVIGIVIILFLVFEPRGLAHRWELTKRFYRLWPFPY